MTNHESGQISFRMLETPLEERRMLGEIQCVKRFNRHAGLIANAQIAHRYCIFPLDYTIEPRPLSQTSKDRCRVASASEATRLLSGSSARKMTPKAVAMTVRSLRAPP